MRQIVTAAAISGLVILGGCNRQGSDASAKNDPAAINMDMKADHMEQMAENLSNAMAADMINNQANEFDQDTGNTSAIASDSIGEDQR